MSPHVNCRLSKPLAEQTVEGEFYRKVSDGISREGIDLVTQAATNVHHAHGFDKFPGLWKPACCLLGDYGRHLNVLFYSVYYFPLRRGPNSLQVDHYIPRVEVTMSHYNALIVFYGTSNHVDHGVTGFWDVGEGSH